MSDTPRSDAWLRDGSAHYMMGEHCKQLERELQDQAKWARRFSHEAESAKRELSACDKERIANLHRAWRAEAQLEVRYGLRKEINAELGLTDETGDDALRKGIETIKALKAIRAKMDKLNTCEYVRTGDVL